MTAFDDATRRQHSAAEPMASTWLSANAGSGKTRVLTDRVARLLLEEVEPQHILCLTYTKAAASEMQNRLFKRLGEWAMLDDPDLAKALADLGLERAPSFEDLLKARTLFARAIETPGGLKIQTIHSFCASLLRRFPLEAGVSPQFTEIEDRAADLLRSEIADQMADGPDAPLLAALARQYSGDEFVKLTKQMVGMSGAFTDLGLDDALRLFGQPEGLTRARIEAATFEVGDRDALRAFIAILAQNGKQDSGIAEKLAKMDASDPLPALMDGFLTQAGTRRARFPTKKTKEEAAHLMPQIEALMERVERARQSLLSLDAAERAVVLHQFARQFTEAYALAKHRRGWLDFDDLIQKARQLLSDDRVAAWVLYRLDGGIDHILVDEAQDTSPAQWDVIRRLAEEFSSGEGARADVTRTIFVVGDKKQSIYSFQGADPKEFDRMQQEFGTKLEESGQILRGETLDYSFRSSPAILKMVDQVFKDAGHAGFDGGQHLAFKAEMPGRVDLWPVVPTPEKEPEQDWFDPLDRRSPEHQFRVLAKHVAAQIKHMIDAAVLIPDQDGARRVEPRDFLILVQRRGGIFPDIIRACKELSLPIAGADRLKVGAEIAVRDLGALLSFLATPDDNLSLATALRSPLFGWSEQELFTLAHYRNTEYLWATLRNQQVQYAETVAMLYDLRENIDFLRPYDLIERVLTRHGGRNRLLARLGAEAEDGINALLSQALAYERASVPSLTGFLAWMETDDLEVKRQVDSASNQIRVMTVHGSKGLEAPIVILPECGKRTFQIKDEIISMEGIPVWKMPSTSQPEPMIARIEQMKAAQQEESLRLLYVALTRAEKWLIVAASGELDKAGNDWHQRVEGAMRACGASYLETPVGDGLRLEHGSWDLNAPVPKGSQDAVLSPLPDYFFAPAAKVEAKKQTLSPSELGGAKAIAGEGLDEAMAKAYGAWVHHLLETNGRPQTTPPSSLTVELQNEGIQEAETLLRDPNLSAIFAPSALIEVSITAQLGAARIHGTIDRLIVTDSHVHIIDFKSNRAVPSTVKDCPEGVLRQMGAYAHALKQIYPEHAQSLSILWTRTGHLMPLPHDMVMAALERAQNLDEAGANT